MQLLVNKHAAWQAPTDEALFPAPPATLVLAMAELQVNPGVHTPTQRIVKLTTIN